MNALFSEAQLALLDVGGRFGPLSEFKRLEHALHLFICEADADEAKKLSEGLLGAGRFRDVTVIADAIDERKGEQSFYLTKKRGLSSLYRPNLKELNTYFPPALVSKWDIDDEIQMPTITLEEARKRYGMDDVSFIKLDTQGSELPIMRSGGSMLNNVVGIYIEIEIKQFYEGQPVLGDVQVFLERHGFVLMEFSPATYRRNSPYNAAYSKPELIWLHALYFKPPHGITGSPEMIVKSKLRLASYAIAYEFFDLALLILAEPEVATALQHIGVETIIGEILALSAEVKHS